jgi:hypothetical protein
MTYDLPAPDVDVVRRLAATKYADASPTEDEARMLRRIIGELPPRPKVTQRRVA